MTNLTEEDGTLTVDGVDDGLPRIDLLLRPDARSLRVPLRGGRHPRGLRDEQAALGGALRVVHGGVRLRHVAVGAAPPQRRKHHPVGELELAHLVRRHQRDHLRGLLHHLACLVALGRRRAAAADEMQHCSHLLALCSSLLAASLALFLAVLLPGPGVSLYLYTCWCLLAFPSLIASPFASSTCSGLRQQQRTAAMRP
jgi:hypothetical protein